MRIISGKFRGKQIQAPKGLPVRPTTDFAKTGLFNILSGHFQWEQVRLLDLFAGTGNLSYEALSRSCEQITAVDQQEACVRFIRQTFEQLKAGERCRVVRSDAFRFIENCTQPYDLILADPPFTEKLGEQIYQRVFETKLLAKDGWLVIEHEAGEDHHLRKGFIEERKYGHVHFSFFKNPDEFI